MQNVKHTNNALAQFEHAQALHAHITNNVCVCAFAHVALMHKIYTRASNALTHIARKTRKLHACCNACTAHTNATCKAQRKINATCKYCSIQHAQACVAAYAHVVQEEDDLHSEVRHVYAALQYARAHCNAQVILACLRATQATQAFIKHACNVLAVYYDEEC
jgi:hypothetical protein